MSKRDLLKQAKQAKEKPYLELLKVGQTFLMYNGQRYSVESAPPDLFDKWIRQFVDQILNVDTFLWDIFDRWQIVNAVLDAGFLTLENNELNRKKKLPIAEECTSELPYVELTCGCIVQATGGWVGVVEWQQLSVQCPNGHKWQNGVKEVEKPEPIVEGK